MRWIARHWIAVLTVGIGTGLSIWSAIFPPNQGLPPQSGAAGSSGYSLFAPAFKQPVLPFPINGEEYTFYGEDGVAPLTVRTGHENINYMIKVVDAVVPDKVISLFFIRAGMSYETKLPLGRFKVKTAEGQNWYGLKYLFGPKTTYFLLGDTFDFDEGPESYEGFMIDLALRENGNLKRTPICPQDW